MCVVYAEGSRACSLSDRVSSVVCVGANVDSATVIFGTGALSARPRPTADVKVPPLAEKVLCEVVSGSPRTSLSKERMRT
jgi:hypothetical protein